MSNEVFPETLPGFGLRLVSDAQFAVIRNFFRQADFDAAVFCQKTGIRDMADFGKIQWDKVSWDAMPVLLAWCIRVFSRGMPSSVETFESLCGAEVTAALHSSGLIRSSRRNSNEVVCPVWLYPVGDFVVASDRREDPEGGVFNPPADVVFPAIYPGTLRFLSLLPTGRGAMP